MTVPAHVDAQFLAHLPFAATSARSASRALGSLLASLDADRVLVENASLVVYELLLNAVEHGETDATGTVEVAWQVTERGVRITVADAGAEGVVAAQTVPLESFRGRGLALVEALSDSWAVERGAGTSVSAELLSA